MSAQKYIRVAPLTPMGIAHHENSTGTRERMQNSMGDRF